MIGSGRSHIRTLTTVAQAQLEDSGTVPEAIQLFASLGNYGAHPQNEERDLHRWLRRLHNLPLEIYTFPMRVNVVELSLFCLLQTCLESQKQDRWTQ